MDQIKQDDKQPRAARDACNIAWNYQFFCIYLLFSLNDVAYGLLFGCSLPTSGSIFAGIVIVRQGLINVWKIECLLMGVFLLPVNEPLSSYQHITISDRPFNT
jgi:hypothetical protein